MLKSQHCLGNIFLFLIVSLRSGCGEAVCRDEISTKGQHFLVTVPPVLDFQKFNCSITIASSGNGHATLVQHNGHNTTKLGNFSLLTGDAKTMYIRGESIHQNATGVQTKVIEIVSSVDVAVYVTGYARGTAASLVVLPAQVLSDEYVAPSYNTGTQYTNFNYLLISSLYNDTHINISHYHSNKTSVNATLSRLESFTLKTNTDPQLATVSSNKPANIVVGNTCTIVSNGEGGCDTIYDSQIPVRYWGKNFIVPPLEPKTGYSVRIYPRTTNTTVKIEYYNNTARRNITFMNMKELWMGTEPTVVMSDHPINVVQYGFSENGDHGDSFMTSVPAVTHFSKDYVFATPFPDRWFIYRLTVTIERNRLDGLLLNGQNVSNLSLLGKWTPSSPFDNYTIITLKIQPGVHTLRHQLWNVKYTALLYALKDSYGFGHSLGFSFPLGNPSTCQNGGSCMSDGKCACLHGFTGDNCEQKLHDDDLVCFDCDYTTALSYCDSIKTCGINQMCYLQRTNGPRGHIHYTSGCADMQVCGQQSQTNGGTTNSTCVQCCDGSFCNSHGCGDNGFPMKESRGPICLDCSFASDPKACDKVTLCGHDELCFIEELPWGDNSIVHLGCKPKQECVLWTGSSDEYTDASFESHGAVMQRSVPLCKTCCYDDYCNRNCTNHNNNNNEIIVG